jgi:dCTP diphosphatase
VTDYDITLADLRQCVADFVAARDWERFHLPRNLSVAIAIEAAELMEHFQWLTHEQASVAMQDEQKRAAVADELADVLIYGFSLANALGIDVSTVVLGKLARNEQRFPVEKWRGCVRGAGGESGCATS